LLTWSTGILLAALSREPAISHILGTNISIARYPLWGVNLSGFSHIFDLTAEFPRFYRCTGHYECLPNLDGIALAQWKPISPLNKHDTILIHCAQGHGRSTTFAAVLLTKMGIFTTPQQAYQTIIQIRPAAKLSSAQYLQLVAFDQNND
jgi:protein-tyrosine phosphatase